MNQPSPELEPKSSAPEPEPTSADAQSAPEVPEVAVPQRLSFTSKPALLTALVLSTVVLCAALYGWYAVGEKIRAKMTAPQALTLLGILILMIAIMLSVGYSRLWADETGITVRNGPLLRRFRIDQIAGLRLRSGDAWAYLLVKADDGLQRRPVLAIQQLEGVGGKQKLRLLRAWLKANGATSKDVQSAAEQSAEAAEPTADKA